MIRASKFAVALAVVALLAACSTIPYSQRLSDRQAAYTAAAGAPVQSFRFFQQFWSWEALGSDQVVVYTRPRTAYLLDVPGCDRLPYDQRIGVSSSLNEVHVGFDRIETEKGYNPCIITKIRPVDVKQLKVVQEKQRKIDAEPRTKAAAG